MKKVRHGGLLACVFVIPALADLWAHWPTSTAYWSSGPGKHKASKEQREGTGETAEWLRVKIAFAETPN